MNHVMEELATVLAYRAQELEKAEELEKQVEAENIPSGDMEDVAGGAKENTQSNETEASPTRKKPRRVYNGKKMKQGRDAMGPILDGRGAGGSGALALCLSSRRNMCVHERVMAESDREAVDAACRSMTASWTCSYFDNFQEAGESTSIPSGVYDLEELQKWGKGRGWCPYYLTRQALNHANILVFNYQYMLDPKVAKMVSKELEAESIVVFDEAHNIDSVCIEALSVTINDRALEYAARSLGRLASEVSRQKASDNQRLQQEYQNLVNGLIDQGLLEAPANESTLGSVSFGTDAYF
jgi:Rad3-related DNA helicase